MELPRTTRLPDETLDACAARAVRDGLGIDVAGLRPFGTVNHIVAKRKITLHGYVGDVNGARPTAVAYESLAWEPHVGVGGYAMATPQVRLLKVLAQHDLQGSLFE